MRGRFRAPYRQRQSKLQHLDYSTKAYEEQVADAKRRMKLYDSLSPRMQKVMKNVEAHIPDLLQLIETYGEDLVIETLKRRGHYKVERKHG